MGITYIKGTVTGPGGQDELRFLVDSGATYTVLPEKTWRKLGLVPRRKMQFQLADGQLMQRDVGTCEIRLELGETPTPVILGEPDDQALLGAVTLQELGLVLNPLTRTFHPMTAFL